MPGLPVLSQRIVFSPLENFHLSISVLQFNWYQARQFPGFYAAADTKYQLHSPFVFELANAVLEDERWYYAFSDIERLRQKMRNSDVQLELTDLGSVPIGGAPQQRRVSVRQLVRVAASSPEQGRFLFRLVQWLKPKRILELGTSLGIGTMYLAAAAREAQLFSLEGSSDCAHVATANLEIMGLQQHTNVLAGPFRDTLPTALRELQPIDLAFFDGHHQQAATLEYFEHCLPCLQHQSVFVFDDIYWSAGMQAAWKQIQEHPKVTLTVDCFELGLVFFNPDFKSKQHFKIVPTRWKPWKTAQLK